MSAERRIRRHRSPLGAIFRQVAGERIPGGCDSCDAFQVVTEPTPGVYLMAVHHDDWCPIYRAMNAGAN